jgi:hypothetical protein
VEEVFRAEFGEGTKIQTTGFMRLMADSVDAIADVLVSPALVSVVTEGYRREESR